VLKHKLMLLLALFSLASCTKDNNTETAYEEVVAWETSKIVRALDESDSYFTNYYYVSGESKQLIRGFNILHTQAPSDFDPVTGRLDYAIDISLLIKILNNKSIKNVNNISNIVCPMSSFTGDSSMFKVLTKESDLQALLAESAPRSSSLSDPTNGNYSVIHPDNVEFKGNKAYCWLRPQGLYRTNIKFTEDGRIKDIQMPFVGFLGIESNLAVRTSIF